MTPAPLILTLRLDPASFARLDALRRAHFPPERNHLPAHVTLFHDLPGDEEEAVRETLAAVCRDAPPLPVRFPKVRFLGKGVAVDVDCPGLGRVRNAVAAAWGHRLTQQDRQPHKPHVTVQNKVPPDEARRLFEFLAGGWEPFAGTADGLLLWRYLGGPWELVEEFPFTGRG